MPILRSERPQPWRYHEPSAPGAILASLADDPRPRAVDPGSIADRILGGWLGRIAGCNVGKPVEDILWTTARLRAYLELADAWPLTDYLPPAG